MNNKRKKERNYGKKGRKKETIDTKKRQKEVRKMNQERMI